MKKTINYKKATLEACKKLIDKYENPVGKIFGDPDRCPLCKLYFKYDCDGCFQETSSRKELNTLKQ